MDGDWYAVDQVLFDDGRLLLRLKFVRTHEPGLFWARSR